MKIKVLYEDSNILAIDKPSGILVHPDQRSKAKTILDLLSKKYPKMEIVHRLDKETSGVMLLAKNRKAHEFLKKQFMARTVKKIYIAIVSGSVKNDRGVINRPIGRSPADFRRYSATRGARGEMREAITQYKVLKRFLITTPEPLLNKEGRKASPPAKGERPKAEGVNFTYLEVRPKTGRTHQIRVHMKYLNHPVVGDELYNPGGAIPLPSLPLRKGEEKRGGRMMLHALSIEFRNLNGKIVKIESPLPKIFKHFAK